jgi:hypothetical protein
LYQSPSNAIYLSALKLQSTSPRRDYNLEILETNKSKKSISILSNLYKVDARTIRFKKAREEILRKQREITEARGMKKENSRGIINMIQVQEAMRQRRERQSELEELHAE